MNKLVVVLAVAVFGLAGCDLFKSGNNTDPAVEANAAEAAEQAIAEEGAMPTAPIAAAGVEAASASTTSAAMVVDDAVVANDSTVAAGATAGTTAGTAAGAAAAATVVATPAEHAAH